MIIKFILQEKGFEDLYHWELAIDDDLYAQLSYVDNDNPDANTEILLPKEILDQLERSLGVLRAYNDTRNLSA